MWLRGCRNARVRPTGLPRGGTVTAHGWKEKRLGALFFPVIHHGLHDGRDIRDPSAADSNGDAGRQVLASTRIGQPSSWARTSPGDILQSTVGKILPDKQKRRKLHSGLYRLITVLPFAFEHSRILARRKELKIEIRRPNCRVGVWACLHANIAIRKLMIVPDKVFR